jgi:hypothetical protein
MSVRGVYGSPQIGAAPYGERRSSLGTWIIGGLLVGGAALWVKHQSDQIAKLYEAAGIPHQSFIEDMQSRSRRLAGAANAGVHSFRQRLNTGKAT